jgi:hypothetical protein
VGSLKQENLTKWMKKPEVDKVPDKLTPPKSPLRITLDVDSVVQDYQDLIAEMKEDKIVLYIKQRQIPIYITKISKDQFFQLCNLSDELSPARIKGILPELEEAMVLSLCQFLISQRCTKIQSKKSIGHSFF